MRRSIVSVVLGVATGCAAHIHAADRVLFPEPLHLVREVSTDAGRNPETIDEYCSGNRIVRVNGTHVAITDYATREVREIDRSSGTFSIASFDEMARARAEIARAFSPPAVADDSVETTHLGLDRVRIRATGLSIELRLDEAITLSRDAFDALQGAAYPDAPRPEHHLMAEAARGGRGGRYEPVADAIVARHRLPVEQAIELEAAGERIRIASKVVRIIREPAPPELLLLRAGARQVEAHLVRFAREMQSLDRVTVPLQ